MSYCGENSLVKHDGDIKRATVLKCRSWKCPTCQPERSKRLMAEANGGAPVTFITVTIRTQENRTPEEEARLIIGAWRCARLRWMRLKKQKAFPFLAVMEATANGRPHLHILTRVWWIDFKWLSAVMAELIDSPHVYLERIKDRARVAGYVAKYCGKAPHQFGSCKRYWKSQDYEKRERWKLKPERPEGVTFTVERMHIVRLQQVWQALGRTCLVDERGQLWTGPPGFVAGLAQARSAGSSL